MPRSNKIGRGIRRRHIALGGIFVLLVIILFGYWTTYLRPYAQTVTTSTELVTNGSFEISTNGTVPDGWTWTGTRLMRKEGWKCGTGAYDGSCWFTIDGNNKPGYLTQTATMSGNAGDIITIRLASKPTRVVGNYSPLFTISYYNGSVTNTYALTFTAGTSASYQVASTTFTAAAPYDSIRIVLPFDQSKGSVDYDGMSITKQ